MKYRILFAALALTAISWAQTATQDTPKEGSADKAPCCAKMASDAKDGHASCARHAMHHDAQAGDEGAQAKMDSCCAGKSDAKAAMSCCTGKDAKSCAKSGEKASGDCCTKDKDKTAGACCGDKCDMKGKGCCADEKKS